MYTIKQLKGGSSHRVAIYLDKIEEHRRLTELGFNVCGWKGPYYYSANECTYSSSSNRENTGAFGKHYLTLPYSDICFEETQKAYKIY